MVSFVKHLFPAHSCVASLLLICGLTVCYSPHPLAFQGTQQKHYQMYIVLKMKNVCAH